MAETWTGASSMNDAARPTVLVVEDEESIRELVCFHLDLAGYECVTADDGKIALRIANEGPLDLIILDLMLPGLDGITLCEAIRRSGPNREVPILILTARREESDKVVGLETGADDYVTKPFGVRELLARVHALMRRPRSTWRGLSGSPQDATRSIGGVTIDPVRRRVTVNGRLASLTPQEFNLLYFLASNAGHVFSRDALLSGVWDDGVFVTERGVDTLVKRLRRKVEDDPNQPTRIITVRGAGYKFDA